MSGIVQTDNNNKNAFLKWVRLLRDFLLSWGTLLSTSVLGEDSRPQNSWEDKDLGFLWGQLLERKQKNLIN